MLKVIYTEGHYYALYAECLLLNVVMLSVLMQNVVVPFSSRCIEFKKMFESKLSHLFFSFAQKHSLRKLYSQCGALGAHVTKHTCMSEAVTLVMLERKVDKVRSCQNGN